MEELSLNAFTIDEVKKETVEMVNQLIPQDVVRIVLYGSCARGDFHADSDIDIALLTKCSRCDAEKYNDILSRIATELAMKYFAIVNFVCLPYDEYMNKKNWYPYFANIEREGVILYG
ncbi:MAG: nucleotidyltransferase domain-containing protein [Lachnospiraceae bacterium]|nr:nucleotidyltransferase domain-containing protein [Lachnospiraceae bacterium]